MEAHAGHMEPCALSCQPGAALCATCLGHQHLSSPGMPLHPRVLLCLAAPLGHTWGSASLWEQRSLGAIPATHPGAAHSPQCHNAPVPHLPAAGTLHHQGRGSHPLGWGLGQEGKGGQGAGEGPISGQGREASRARLGFAVGLTAASVTAGRDRTGWEQAAAKHSLDPAWRKCLEERPRTDLSH